MIDPTISALMSRLGELDLPPVTVLDPADARARSRALSLAEFTPGPVIPVARWHQRAIPGADGELAVRIYWPSAQPGRPTVVYFHGGGWVLGDLDSADHEARLLCTRADAVVVSVAYREAPENPFPAAVDDAAAAVAWARAEIATLGGDETLLAVAGESAGATIAAVTTAGGQVPGICAQLLLYPPADLDEAAEYPSRTDPAMGLFLTTESMQWFVRHYAGDTDRTEPRLSPLRARVAGLPPTLVVTAGFDPLRDEIAAYAQAMATAGSPVTAMHFPDLPHGFVNLAARSAGATAAAGEVFAAFGELLRTR